MSEQPYIIGKDLRVGPKYTSEDMYRDFPEILPGARVTVERDGVLYTDIVQSITYNGPTPAVYGRRSWWQRLLRRSPKLIRSAEPASYTMNTGPVIDEVRDDRHIASLQKAGEVIDGLIRNEPGDLT